MIFGAPQPLKICVWIWCSEARFTEPIARDPHACSSLFYPKEGTHARDRDRNTMLKKTPELTSKRYENIRDNRYRVFKHVPALSLPCSGVLLCGLHPMNDLLSRRVHVDFSLHVICRSMYTRVKSTSSIRSVFLASGHRRSLSNAGSKLRVLTA